MTVALCIMCVGLFVFVNVLVAVIDRQGQRFAAERSAWGVERIALVNRAIARHAGEVRVLDNQRTTEREPQPARPVIGLEG